MLYLLNVSLPFIFNWSGINEEDENDIFQSEPLLDYQSDPIEVAVVSS